MADSFFAKFSNRFPLPKEQWDEYISYYHRMEAPARTILLREGEVSGKAYFIEKGCVRAWFSNNIERVQLADIAAAWQRDDLEGKRLVIIPSQL
ncbi:MAG TPA: hypothetical protein VKR41_02155 [Puia sp.]|nr:hypothetical protein [Puia sp.]